MQSRRTFYSQNFKINAVKLSYNGSSLKNLAAEFGIAPCLLTRWRQEYEKYGSGCFCGSGHSLVHPDKEKIFLLEKKDKEAEIRLEILTKAAPFLHRGNLTIYQFIKDNEKKYGVLKMCKILDVGPGRYIRWKYKGISKKRQYILRLEKELTSIFLGYKKHAGRNKLTKELNSRGFKISIRRVGFYMKKLGLKRIKKRKFTVTTESTHKYYTVPNVLNQRFKTDSPSKIWVSDITYLPVQKGFLYLTVIMDLYDRKIIGWSLSSRLFTVRTTIAAWNKAVLCRKADQGLIFHSDRGAQYANRAFCSILKDNKCIRSMSRKGSSIDNAVAESFFRTLKNELPHKKNLLTKKQMSDEIFDFIENWYNKKRIHSTLNYKTIPQFNSLKGRPIT